MGNSAATYAPTLFVTVARVRPVSWLTTVTVAPGRTACVESRTVPRTVAVVRCAYDDAGRRTARSAKTTDCLRIFRLPPPFLKRFNKVLLSRRSFQSQGLIPLDSRYSGC